MSKFFQAFLMGMLFTFILDFFIFLGIKQNYIDFYEIDLYYNILFADNQNIYLYLALTLITGFIIIYTTSNKFTLLITGTLLTLAFSTLIPPIGHSLGAKLFMKENATLYTKKYSYTGTIYYSGREKVVMYDNALQKKITLNKKELK